MPDTLKGNGNGNSALNGPASRPEETPEAPLAHVCRYGMGTVNEALNLSSVSHTETKQGGTAGTAEHRQTRPCPTGQLT